MVLESLYSVVRHAQQAEVLTANVGFFRETASKFDAYESHMFDQEMQRPLEEDLSRIANRFAPSRRPIRCLDCGGGTGNLTLKMLKRGWTVTVVDISRDMLTTLEKKIFERGYSATLVCNAVEDFLHSTTATYDLISFSAVLHHLHSYLVVIDAAASRINQGGFLYTNLDPVRPPHPSLTRAFSTLDTILAKVLFDPQGLSSRNRAASEETFLEKRSLPPAACGEPRGHRRLPCHPRYRSGSHPGAFAEGGLHLGMRQICNGQDPDDRVSEPTCSPSRNSKLLRSVFLSLRKPI